MIRYKPCDLTERNVTLNDFNYLDDQLRLYSSKQDPSSSFCRSQLANWIGSSLAENCLMLITRKYRSKKTFLVNIFFNQPSSLGEKWKS